MVGGSAQWGRVLTRHPLARGMASYCLVWPLGSLVQQTVEGRSQYDLARMGRFSIYGALYVAPTLTVWMTIARKLFPQATLSSAIAKALIEQISYTPFAITSFYFWMTLLEGKGVYEAKKEVSEKFIPTYQVGATVWPLIQVFNYSVIPERNRVLVAGVCSAGWTSFLAVMKYMRPSGSQSDRPV